MEKRKTYIDDNGYLRYDDNDNLVHKKIAYDHIYTPNKDKYPLLFGRYRVQHKDEDKLNNDPSNLELKIAFVNSNYVQEKPLQNIVSTLLGKQKRYFRKKSKNRQSI